MYTGDYEGDDFETFGIDDGSGDVADGGRSLHTEDGDTNEFALVN